MQRLLILILLLSSFGLSADTSKSKIINNLTVTVHNKKFIEVYKGLKHMFSYDCGPNVMCNIYTTTKDDPVYRIFDGVVYTPESEDLMPLKLENIREIKGSNPNFYDGSISIFVSRGAASGAYGNNTMYRINTESGSVSMSREEYYHYLYGMAKPGQLYD
tara:strand:+ start:633 stop:1112 length:480 start_codon:yes stop_codon:yes gene_type:complete